MASKLTCEEITELDPGDTLWQDWTDLLERVTPEHALFGPAWFRAWNESYGKQGRWGGQLRLIAVRDGARRLHGVLPLARLRLGPLKADALAGDWQPWRVVLAARGSEQDVASALADCLRKRGTPIRLGPCPQSSEVVAALLNRLSDGAVFVHRLQTAPLALCRLPATWKEYRDDVVGKKHVKKVEYYERRTARQAPLKIEHIRRPSPEQTKRLLADLGEIERLSWLTERGGNMRFAPAVGRALWQGLIDGALTPKDQFDCWLMHFDGKPASFVVTITAPPVRYVIANNYDQAVADHRTGATLFRYMLEEAFTRGVRQVDFGDGELHYKGLWGAKYLDAVDVHLVVPGRVQGWSAAAALRVQAAALQLRAALRKRKTPGPQAPEQQPQDADPAEQANPN